MPERFKNDVFISYRHASNENPDHWVAAFHTALYNSLREMLGRDVTIWRDSLLNSEEPFRNELRDALDSAAIFLPIFVTGYLHSDECLRELDYFLKHMKEDARGARKLFPVYKHPPDPQRPPPREVSDLQRHEFYLWKPPGTGRFTELGPRGADTGERNFWTSLSWLAQDIQKSLVALEQVITRDALGKVFLARTCPELDPLRNALRADLQLSGYVVVPACEYMWNTGDSERQIVDDLRDTLLSIHLVSAERSNDRDSVAHSRRQLLLAHAAHDSPAAPGGHGAPPLVWIQPASAVDATAAALIGEIEGELANAGVEYLRGSFEALKTEVYAKLRVQAKPVEAPADTPATTAATAIARVEAAAPARHVALIVEENEIGQLGGLSALLADRLGVEAKLIKFGDGAPKDAQRMQRVLDGCAQCIVFWGGRSDEWLEDLLDHPALAGHLGRDRLCVHIAAPASDAKAVFRTPKASVVDATVDDAETGLRGFLKN